MDRLETATPIADRASIRGRPDNTRPNFSHAMSALAIFGVGCATAVILFFSVWVVQWAIRNAGWVDVVWTATMGVLALEYALAGSAPVSGRVLMAGFMMLWSLRLASHVAIRISGVAEERRYVELREHWGSRTQIYMLGFFLSQAVVSALMSLPFLVIAYRPDTPSIAVMVAAAVLWLVAVSGEALADTQLQRFKQRPENKGAVCARGLWRYSRHPNYFFEWLHWFTYVILAIGAPWWWVTLISPAIMLWLLFKVTGIPTVESAGAIEKRRGYDEYVRATSMFVPWPPKK